MGEQINISAKTLGQLAMPNACNRCFWLKVKMRQNMPYGIFPSIFSSFDTFQKRVIESYYQEHHVLPSFLDGYLGIVAPVAAPSRKIFRLTVDNAATGIAQDIRITLTGAVDALFICKDSSYAVFDYKTARYSKNQDTLHPMYETQLNVYSMIANHIGIPVKSMALVYFDPDTVTATEKAVVPEGLELLFRAKKLEVRCAPEEIVRPLLKRAGEILSYTTPPPSHPQCRDCKGVDQMLQLLHLSQ